jgi:DNA-binding response OmpR family regulator
MPFPGCSYRTDLGKTPHITGNDFVVNLCDMKDEFISRTVEPANTPIQGQTIPPRRILLVDDDTAVRVFNKTVLTQAGYEVDEAADGGAGFAALQSCVYDLVITDNSMPKVTGVEMLKKLRAARLSLPVIMATGAAPTDEFARYPWLQPDITLLTPYSVTEMLNAVEVVLRVADTREQGPPLPKRKSTYG